MSDNPKQGTQEISEGFRTPAGAGYTTFRSRTHAVEIQD